MFHPYGGWCLLWTETLLPIGWHSWWVPQCVESCLASLASGTAEWDPASASAVAKTQEELNEAMGISRQSQRHSDPPWRRSSARQHHVLQSQLKSYWLSHHERCEPCPPHVSSSGAVLGNHWVIEPHKCQAGRQCEPSLKSLVWPGRDQTHNLPVLFSWGDAQPPDHWAGCGDLARLPLTRDVLGRAGNTWRTSWILPARPAMRKQCGRILAGQLSQLLWECEVSDALMLAVCSLCHRCESWLWILTREVALCQCCPLSPILFIISMDRMSRDSQNADGV